MQDRNKSEMITLYLINPTNLAKSAALQQLATELRLLKIGIAVAETWFTSLHTDNLVNIDGYNLFRKDRLNKTADGVAVHVRDDIDASV